MERKIYTEEQKTFIEEIVRNLIKTKWTPSKICNIIGLRKEYFPEMQTTGFEWREPNWQRSHHTLYVSTKYLKGYFFEESTYHLEIHIKSYGANYVYLAHGINTNILKLNKTQMKILGL